MGTFCNLTMNRKLTVAEATDDLARKYDDPLVHKLFR